MKRFFLIFLSMFVAFLLLGCNARRTTASTTASVTTTTTTTEELTNSAVTTEALSTTDPTTMTTAIGTTTIQPTTTATTAEPATTTIQTTTPTTLTTQATTITIITTETETTTTTPTTVTTTMAPQEYTIVFVENGGSEVTDIVAFEGSIVTEPTAPAKEGHTFAGWFSDDEFTSEYVFSVMPSENLSLYAKWTPNTYLIEYLIVDENLNAYISLAPGESIIEISLGEKHSGALTSFGRVFTWGHDIQGQLGNGAFADSFPNPIDITGNFTLQTNEKIIDIDMGNYHSAALSSTGRLFTWGDNFEGKLGNNSTNNSNIPVDITANFSLGEGEKILGIAMGYTHSMALTSAGRVFSWGYNYYGQVGDGTTLARHLPVDITFQFAFDIGEAIVKIETGNDHSAVLTSSGRLFVWGHNNFGQLGIGELNYNANSTPTEITSHFNLVAEETIMDIDFNGNVSSAISSSSRVFTWGENSYGNLGIGTSESVEYKSTPYDISNKFGLDPTDKIISLSLGYFHGSALSDFGKIFTWGRNEEGQLGNNTIINHYSPEAISLGFELVENEKIVKISMGTRHSSAMTSEGRVFLWGFNYNGEVGNGETSINQLIPDELQTEKTEKIHEESYVYGETVTVLIPTKEGYTFDGWYIDSDFQQAFSLTIMPAGDIDLYGRWIPDL